MEKWSLLFNKVAGENTLSDTFVLPTKSLSIPGYTPIKSSIDSAAVLLINKQIKLKFNFSFRQRKLKQYLGFKYHKIYTHGVLMLFKNIVLYGVDNV